MRIHSLCTSAQIRPLPTPAYHFSKRIRYYSNGSDNFERGSSLKDYAIPSRNHLGMMSITFPVVHFVGDESFHNAHNSTQKVLAKPKILIFESVVKEKPI